MKRYWVNELAIIEIDDFNFDYDKPQWKKVYLASEVDAERAEDKEQIERLLKIHERQFLAIQEYSGKIVRLQKDIERAYQEGYEEGRREG
jgi:flagellar biosynthesis/type III secretory pathway protein FliH